MKWVELSPTEKQTLKEAFEDKCAAYRRLRDNTNLSHVSIFKALYLNAIEEYKRVYNSFGLVEMVNHGI
jgi:hypothetical protein